MTARARPPGTRVSPPRIGRTLVDWFTVHQRPLPWRADRDPYRRWVAEVLLQQTRVAQAIPYFERFVRQFPDVRTLAAADQESVLKAWEGAGYYARARHLLAAARRVVRVHGGEIPRTIEGLESLEGVGPYIARSVASAAFGSPELAIDANGWRVAARWSREEGLLTESATRRRLAAVLTAARPRVGADVYGEAIMELGETICRPTDPRCDACPVRFGCRAGREVPQPDVYPRRGHGRARPQVRGTVVVLERNGRWLVQRRPSDGLLGGLWEFPGGKIGPGESAREAARRELKEETGRTVDHLIPRGVVSHAYSHFSVELDVFVGRAGRAPLRPAQRWVTPAEFERLPRPEATRKIARLVGAARGSVSPDSGSRPGRTPVSSPAAPGRRPARVRSRPRTA